MSIRKIGNRWQVRIRLGGGRRVEQTLPPGSTRADALALEVSLRRSQIDAAVGRRPEYLIDDALNRWVETSAQHLKSWQKDLRYRIGVLREHTANQPLSKLPEVADAIKRAGIEGGASAAAINRMLANLRRIGNLAERWGWTDAPLGRRVMMLPENNQRHVYLTPEQITALAKHADPVTADMIWFAALTGLRRGEMLALRPDQIHEDIIALGANTKSGKPRGIPMPPRAVKIARKRLPWGVHHETLRKRFETAREAAGMPNVRWHDLRHTYASWLAQSGQPMSAIRDLMGHSSLAVTDRYAHLAPHHLRAAVATLPNGERVGKNKTKISKKPVVRRTKKAA